MWRFPGNATATKHSPPEAPKEGYMKNKYEQKQMPLVKPQTVSMTLKQAYVLLEPREGIDVNVR